MGVSTISLGLGLGGGKAATSSGRSGGGGSAFNNLLSASLDGSNDSIDVSSNPNLDVYTCSLWFKTAETNFSLPIAGFGKNGSQYGGIRFIPVVAGRAIEYNDGVQYIAAGGLSNSDVFDDEWHHVAIVYVASGYETSTGTASNNGQGYKIFFNGSRVDTALGSTGHDFSLATTHALFSVGKERTSFYDGLIDEVAIFGSSLSDANIATIYNSGVPADLSGFSPTLWWRMGDAAGDTNSSGGTPSNGDSIGTIKDLGSGGNDGIQGTAANKPTFSNSVPS